MIIRGNIVDIFNRSIFKGEIEVSDGKIIDIRPCEHDVNNFILPGFIDAHIHLESSMVVPSEFAKIALIHGTVATVSDPNLNEFGSEGLETGIQLMDLTYDVDGAVLGHAKEIIGLVKDYVSKNWF